MRAKGAALITALLMIALLMTLAMGRLFFAQQAYSVVSREERNTEAYYLAISGIRYCRFTSSTFTIGKIYTRAVPRGDTTHFLEVYIDSTNTIHSKGFIQNSYGKILAQKVLVVPNGQSMDVYDEGL